MYTLGPAPTSTLRTIPFTIPTSAWTESNGIYTATFASVYITETSKEMCTFDESLRNRAKRDINISKTSGGGSITLTTSALPTGAISGTIFTIDADDGKVCMVIEDTVFPITNGGTGANTLAGAKENLGISAIAEQVEELSSSMTRFTLLASGNSDVSENVALSDSMANYRWLFITTISVSGTYGNIYLDGSYIPVSLLKSADCGGFGANGYSSGRTYCLAAYVSDTTLYVQSTAGFRIYGIN